MPYHILFFKRRLSSSISRENVHFFKLHFGILPRSKVVVVVFQLKAVGDSFPPFHQKMKCVLLWRDIKEDVSFFMNLFVSASGDREGGDRLNQTCVTMLFRATWFISLHLKLVYSPFFWSGNVCSWTERKAVPLQLFYVWHLHSGL